MTKLFQTNRFNAIMAALYMPKNAAGRQNAFYGACGNDLTTEEKDWLWNYLKNCFGDTDPPLEVGHWKKGNVNDVAANSGW